MVDKDPVMAAVALAFRYGTEVDDINQIYLRSTLFSLNISSRSFHLTHITVYPRISGSDLPWSARKTHSLTVQYTYKTSKQINSNRRIAIA